MFSHVYVWVNRGEWRTHTSEEAALSEARHAAMKANRWDEIMDADRIIIDKLPCDGLHDKELCNHLRVSFYQTKEAS